MSVLMATTGLTTTFDGNGDVPWDKYELGTATTPYALKLNPNSFGFKQGFDRAVVATVPVNKGRNRRAELYFGKPLFGSIAFIKAGELAGVSGADEGTDRYVRTLKGNSGKG